MLAECVDCALANVARRGDDDGCGAQICHPRKVYSKRNINARYEKRSDYGAMALMVRTAAVGLGAINQNWQAIFTFRYLRSANSLVEAIAGDGEGAITPPVVHRPSSDQLCSQDLCDHVRAVSRPRLEPHVFDMAFDRRGCDLEAQRGFFGGKTICHVTDDVGLARCQRQQSRCLCVVNESPLTLWRNDCAHKIKYRISVFFPVKAKARISNRNPPIRL